MDKRSFEQVKMGADEFNRALRRLTRAATRASGALDRLSVTLRSRTLANRVRRSVIQGLKGLKRKMARDARRINGGE